MDMTVSDWLDVTPSEWMERTIPGWRAGYGDLMQRTPRDWLETMYGPRGTQAFWPGVQPMHERRYRHRRCGCEDSEHRKRHWHDCGCPQCAHDACECYCCVGDVDIVVYTRMGEQRVVPITVANERRREKSVKLELSSWATRAGDTGIVRTIRLEPDEFTLEPCGEKAVTLIFQVRGEQPDTDKDLPDREHLPDVDNCRVVTADLRLVGCDHRSIRIAAAVLPRDCDPFRVSCGCTCC